MHIFDTAEKSPVARYKILEQTARITKDNELLLANERTKQTNMIGFQQATLLNTLVKQSR